MPTRMKWMATGDPPQAHPTTTKQSVPLYRDQRVLRARWLESTRWRGDRRDTALIEPNEPHAHARRESTRRRVGRGLNVRRHHRLVCTWLISVNSSSLSCSNAGSVETEFLTITTKSQPAGTRGLFSRNTSRSRRFHRLRWAAFPTLRVTVRPSRGLSSAFFRPTTIKCGPLARRPSAATRLKSARCLSRDRAGNDSSCARNFDHFLCWLTANTLRPRVRRRRSTSRPPRVCLRARKPWVRVRLRLLGWYVRFVIVITYCVEPKRLQHRCFNRHQNLRSGGAR